MRSVDRSPRTLSGTGWRFQAKGGARERKSTRSERLGAVSIGSARAMTRNANRVGNAGGIAICVDAARLSAAQISQTYPSGSSAPPLKELWSRSEIDCARLACALKGPKWTCPNEAANWISSAKNAAATQILFCISNQPMPET